MNLTHETYQLLTSIWLGVAVAVFALLIFVPAPYGRHLRAGWGPTLPSRAGWILMETPAVLVLPAMVVASGRLSDPGVAALTGTWLLHYLHRAWIYPFRRRDQGRRMPVVVALLGTAFNLFNGWFNGLWLAGLGGPLGAGWLGSAPFLAGTALFALGLALNLHADTLLMRLRAPGETAYRIPRGGLFRWVSCPNYLGEILEWVGWAIAAASPGGLAFAAWTVANLAPRARAHHRWYRDRFEGYPEERRALLPFLF